MAWFIDDYSRTKIRITDTIREWIIPKFRIDMEVEEPYLYLRWNDSEVSPNVPVRLLTMNYLDVVDNYSGYIDNPISATNLMAQIDAMIETAWTDISTGGGDILNGKGQLLSHDGVSDTILPVGDDTWILQANSAESTGLEWVPLSTLPFAGAVTDTSTVDLTLSSGTLSGAVIKQMSIDSDASGLKLVNDATTPGTYKGYGTSSAGVKGYVTNSFVIGSTGLVTSALSTPEQNLWFQLIPGGTITTNDVVEVLIWAGKTSGTGNVQVNVKWSTTSGTTGTLFSQTAGTANNSWIARPIILVRGASDQIASSAFVGNTYTTGAVHPTSHALNTANDIYVNITMSKATGTDGFLLYGASVIIHKYRA